MWLGIKTERNKTIIGLKQTWQKIGWIMMERNKTIIGLKSIKQTKQINLSAN